MVFLQPPEAFFFPWYLSTLCKDSLCSFVFLIIGIPLLTDKLADCYNTANMFGFKSIDTFRVVVVVKSKQNGFCETFEQTQTGYKLMLIYLAKPIFWWFILCIPTWLIEISALTSRSLLLTEADIQHKQNIQTVLKKSLNGNLAWEELWLKWCGSSKMFGTFSVTLMDIVRKNFLQQNHISEMHLFSSVTRCVGTATDST